MNQIIIYCPRQCTTFVRLTQGARYLEIEYGNLEGRELIIQEFEQLRYEDHPEFLNLFTENAWNITEVYCLVHQMPDMPELTTQYNPLMLTADEFTYLSGG